MAVPFPSNGDTTMPWPDNAPTLDSLPSLSPEEIAALPAETLAGLHCTLEGELKRLKEMKSQLDAGLECRYGTRVAELRRALGKDTGTVRFEDDGVTVVANLPKRVDWDQRCLATVIERIRSAGEDPGEYVDIAYKVPERKYAAWPQAIRQSFASARTVRTGALSISFLSGGVEE
jgi:hypothetical protein